MKEFVNAVRSGDYFTAAQLYNDLHKSEADKVLKQYNCKTEVMLLLETDPHDEMLYMVD